MKMYVNEQLNLVSKSLYYINKEAKRQRDIIKYLDNLLYSMDADLVKSSEQSYEQVITLAGRRSKQYLESLCERDHEINKQISDIVKVYKDLNEYRKLEEIDFTLAEESFFNIEEELIELSEEALSLFNEKNKIKNGIDCPCYEDFEDEVLFQCNLALEEKEKLYTIKETVLKIVDRYYCKPKKWHEFADGRIYAMYDFAGYTFHNPVESAPEGAIVESLEMISAENLFAKELTLDGAVKTLCSFISENCINNLMI